MDKKFTLEDAKKDATFMQILRVIQLEKPESKIFAEIVDSEYFKNFHVTDSTIADCEKIGKMIDSNYSHLRAGSDMDYPFWIAPLSSMEASRGLDDVTEVR